MNLTTLRYETIGSTNTEAAQQARQGASEGLCIIARQQSDGRGRHGRTWVSGPDAGVYFSIVLRPRFEARQYPLITLMAGVAVFETLKELNLDPDIKWVNDILIGDKKIAGILAETAETNLGTAVILGIGINLKSTNFPAEIADTATSVTDETGAEVTVDQTVSILTRKLKQFYDVLHGENGSEEILENWRRRSSYHKGKMVRVSLPDRVIEGTTDGLEQNGALRVKTSDGSVTIVQAGDVERLRERAV